MNYFQILLSLWLLRMAVVLSVTPVGVKTPEEANGKPYYINLIGLANSHGYKAEDHMITTEDGYIIRLFRILSRSASPEAEQKPVALIAPGLTVLSECYAIFNRSISYFLTDNGYDVWIGNSRGNTHGRAHKTLSPDVDKKFWNFSWHETGILDYPATIDYILAVTNKSSLTLIGHSMGATSGVVLLSERPEYNKKVNMFVAFGPFIFWKTLNIVRIFLWYSPYLFGRIIDPFGWSEFFPQGQFLIEVFKGFCQKLYLADWCIELFGLIVGYDPQQATTEDLFAMLQYFPAGSSTKSMWHYGQISVTNSEGELKKYDYGYENQMYYGQSTPPSYNLTNIVTNMLIYYSDNDPFCNLQDAELLASKVSTNATIERVPYDKFAHADYIVAKDVKTLFHDRLLEIISNYKD